MTLIELVVTISVIGAIATVLAAAVTVTFRQQADTDGNLDVARWEQALALWLPTDLASANPTSLDDTPDSTVITTAGCGAECAGSSNALTLSFDDGSGMTTVSYRYGPDPDGGDAFVLTRVECHGGTCSSRVILRDLAAPADTGWVGGTDEPPSNVISVSAPESVDDSGTPGEDSSAVTVTVSVNGVPDGAGVARSSSVSVTAGGIVRTSLDTPSFEGPSFVEARSGCGGPVTLIVDDSGSIGSSGVVNVRRGVESFVRAFEGTPTDLKVIRFDGSASTLGTSGWHRSFDLSEPAEVFELVGDATEGVGGYLGNIVDGGSTDWQEALVRTFYTDASATTSFAEAGDPSRPAPELVVFFTDGLPNRDIGIPSSLADMWDYNSRTRAWYRANYTAELHRSSTRFIGVGLGSGFSGSQTISHPEWPTYSIPNRVFLGDLISGIQNPSQYDGSAETFETVTWSAGSGWGDVSTADVLTTTDFAQLGSGLAAIALAECGGTLTIQTREASTGDPADAEITYTLGAEQVTTSRINKSGTFDVPFGGSSSANVDLVPAPLDGTGYVAVGWSCAAGGVDLVEGTDWSLISAGDPGAGINLTVTPNAAVSCTLEVA